MNANQASVVFVAPQPELLTPGSWSMSTTGGTATATESPAGTLNLAGDGTFDGRGDQSITTVVGRTYVISQLCGTNNTINVRIGTSQFGTQILGQTATFSFRNVYFVATTTTTWIGYIRRAAGSFSVSSISCKVVP